jgi:tetratricopeptide (TPR) repeat protein
MNKGLVLADLGKYDEALQAFDKIDPRNFEVKIRWFGKGHDQAINFWEAKGKGLEALGRKTEAEQAFEKEKELRKTKAAVQENEVGD